MTTATTSAAWCDANQAYLVAEFSRLKLRLGAEHDERVVASRLENEYGVQVIFENYNCSTARWIHGDAAELRQLSDRYSANVALDGADDPVYLAPNNVYLNMVKEKYPNLRFAEAREVI